jgi:ketosteroid isomerase-like protein
MAFCSLTLVGSAVKAQADNASAPQALRVAVDELVAADKSFAAAAAKTDLISGISAMFDEDVIVPVPGGKIAQNKAEVIAAMRANAANATAKVNWSAVKAGVSADGKQGFTLGYVTVEDAGKPAPRLSKYLAYWAKRPSGWRVIAYKREPRPTGDVSLKMLPPLVPRRELADAGAEAVTRMEAELAQSEAAFSGLARGTGMGTAIRKFASPDTISLGSAPEVTVGIEELAKLDLPAVASWSADGARVAPSGDLGFTWGISRPDAPLPGQEQAVFPFFAVWGRAGPNDGWRVLAR